MHQPQHQEEDEPEDGHSLQGQVQQRHPPAWPTPAAAADSAPAGGEGGRPARGRRSGEKGGERKGRRGVGAEGAGRACAPPPARTRSRAGLGALADAGVAVSGLSGQGGRGPTLRLASPPPHGRRPDPTRLRLRRRRPAAPPPPCRLAAGLRAAQLRALLCSRNSAY